MTGRSIPLGAAGAAPPPATDGLEIVQCPHCPMGLVVGEYATWGAVNGIPGYGLDGPPRFFVRDQSCRCELDAAALAILDAACLPPVPPSPDSLEDLPF